MNKALARSPPLHKPGVVVHAHDPSMWGQRQKDQEVKGDLWLLGELEHSLAT